MNRLVVGTDVIVICATWNVLSANPENVMTFP